jgi:hypothetical protein
MTRLAVIFFAVAAGSSGPAMAQEVAQAAPAAARAGVAGAVSGEVALAAMPGVRAVGKDAVSGDPIYLGDKITTGADGRLQIMLLDETVFTLGPKAALTVDKFVYDPSTGAGKVSATILQGAFRFVTGKIAQREPTDMEVNLPVGTIGVRGTSVAGETDGAHATVVLLGPGPDNDAGERVGRILVTGTGPVGSGKTVEIVRPGFATEITAPNSAPGAPVRLDAARLTALTARLSGTEKPAEKPEQRPPSTSAAPKAATLETSPKTVPAASTVSKAANSPAATGLASVKTVSALVSTTVPKTATTTTAAQAPKVQFPDGSTTFAQLHTITSGTAVIQANGIALTPSSGTGSGSYNFKLSFNFGTRTETATVTGSYNLAGTAGSINYTNTVNYGSLTGVVGNTSGVSLTSANAGLHSGNFGTLIDNPRNSANKPLALTDVTLRIFNNSAGCGGSSACLSGTKTGITR